MTNQEAFDKVCNHLRRMLRRSIDRTGNYCSYRSKNGNKCAIGCLIPDEEYKPEFERRSVAGLIQRFWIPSLDGISSLLLLDLQELHDRRYNWNEYGFNGESGLEYIALKYDLRYTSHNGNRPWIIK